MTLTGVTVTEARDASTGRSSWWGAANGLGRATALRLTREGARLALVDVDAEALEPLARTTRTGTPTHGHGRQFSGQRRTVARSTSPARPGDQDPQETTPTGSAL